ncbi:MAG: fructose-6-phosphate aldolase [Chlorobi bacterium]|nr:fructose-6-phosphate aldolase [Chlorobiota bacterium]MCI0716309.1 fructose-6-phosphate aldolase [Chlorobiota bacterium]
MKIFIDTGNLNEIKEAASYGILDGVTTNPSLMAKEGHKDARKCYEEICKMVSGPVSAEVISTDYEGILKEGRELSKIAPNIYVKVPLIIEGLKAVKTFAEEGINTNVTLCFSPSQAVLAAKAGATIVSPFIGRLDDISQEGMYLIEQIIRIYGNYGYETEILVASIRHPLHFVEACMLGADVCTMPFKVMQQLVKHPLTDIGLEKFISDWKKNIG